MNASNLDLKIPTEWNKLSRKQLLYVCRMFLLKKKESDFRLLVFLKLTNVKALPKRIIADQVFYFFKYKKQQFSLTVPELNWFCNAVDYLRQDSRLTVNLFPWLRVFHRKYYGPSKKCYNVCFNEFINAEACIYAYHTTKNLKHLRQLTAVLYRRQKKNYNPGSAKNTGDRREPFNDYTYQHRARQFRFLSKEKLLAVYCFYIGSRNALMEAHPDIFKGGTVSSEPVNPVKNLQELMYSLNQGDLTKIKELEQVQVWTVFGQLQHMVVENEKLKKKK